MRTERDQRMTVPVRIGANDSFSFVVDTGSQTTVVARDIAERLALPPARRARVIGIGGSEMADTAIVEEMGLGRRSFSDVEVVLFEGQHIGADGIVGIDSLQRQRVLLDFAGNRLAVGSARSLGGNSGYEIVVTARRKLGQLIMTDAVIDGVRTSVVIDTGADTSIGNRALQRRLSQRGPREQASLLSVTGQRIDAEIGYPRKLAIGSIEITNLLVAFTDAPVFDVLDLADKPALLLGMRELRLFERVAIDFDSRRVFFDIPS
jgi:predicted aspartyl protease